MVKVKIMVDTCWNGMPIAWVNWFPEFGASNPSCCCCARTTILIHFVDYSSILISNSWLVEICVYSQQFHIVVAQLQVKLLVVKHLWYLCSFGFYQLFLEIQPVTSKESPWRRRRPGGEPLTVSPLTSGGYLSLKSRFCVNCSSPDRKTHANHHVLHMITIIYIYICILLFLIYPSDHQVPLGSSIWLMRTLWENFG